MNIRLLMPLFALAACLAAMYCCTRYDIRAESVTLNVYGDSAAARMYDGHALSGPLADTLTRLAMASQPRGRGTRRGGPPTPRGVAANAPADGLSALEKGIGKGAVDVIANAKSVESYVIDPHGEAADSAGAFRGFKAVGAAVALDGRQADELRGVLLNGAYHRQGSLVKNCAFLPDVGFRFHADGRMPVDVMVALYCDEWLFIAGDGRYQNDCAGARPALDRVIADIYPKTGARDAGREDAKKAGKPKGGR